VQALAEGTAVITAETNGITGTVGLIVQGAGATIPVSAHAATIAVPQSMAAAAAGRQKRKRRLATAALLLLLGSAGAWGTIQSGLIGGAASEGNDPGVVAPDGPVETLPVATIDFGDHPDTVQIGSDLVLSARGLDESGAPAAEGQAVTWAVDDEARAHIEQDGTLVPLAAGPVAVTATIAGLTETITLLLEAESAETVSGSASSRGGAGGTANNTTPSSGPATRPAPAASRVTSLALAMPPTVVIGSTINFAARVLDQRGDAMDRELDRVRWRSSDPLVLRLGTGDFFDAVGPGTATITARLGALTETVDVTVSAPVERIELDRTAVDLEVGDNAALTATVLGPNGIQLPASSVRWRSTDANVATVDASGRVTAVGRGRATVAAGAEGVAGRAQVTVRPRRPQQPTEREARTAADVYIQMLNDGDEAAITRAYDPTENDRLDDLLDFVDNNNFAAALVEDESLGGVPLTFSFDGREFGVVNFRLRFTYASTFGGERVQLRDFRLVFTRRQDGSGWRLVSSVMLDD
jgi:uncharacterized protein YjdB